jgi:GNAT superfamily N-acetyltransferase
VAVEIRRLRDRDEAWEDLKALLSELLEYHRPFQPRTLSPGWEEVWHDYIRPNEDRRLLLARDDAQTLGYLNACIRRTQGLLTETYGWIDDAYLRPNARRQGVGAAMLETAEEWFGTRDVEEIRLNVVGANDIGVGHWSKSGFSPLHYVMTKVLTRVSS